MSQLASDAKISSAMAALGMTAPLPNLDDSQVLKAILVALGNVTGGLHSGSTITDIINQVINPTEYSVGYLGIPQNSQSADYTTVLTDSGKHIYRPAAAPAASITWTIPADASVAYPIGTALTFVNGMPTESITIAITSDTLIFAGVGSSGSRTLAANSMATAIKLTSTSWMISGTGLS